MEFNPTLQIPLSVRSTKDLLTHMPQAETCEKYYIQRRIELMTEVLSAYHLPNKRGFPFKKIARMILEANGYAKPLHFYSPQKPSGKSKNPPKKRFAEWEDLDAEGKVGKIQEKLNDVTQEKLRTFVRMESLRETEEEATQNQGRPPAGRTEWMDFLLYIRAYDPLRTATEGRARVERMNVMLSALGYSDLYLFSAEDFPVLAALILDLSYAQYLEMLDKGMDTLLEEQVQDAAKERESRQKEKQTDLFIPLPDNTRERLYTGVAEERWLWQIRSVGSLADPPIDPDEPPSELSAFQFAHLFSREFGRARRTVHRAFSAVFGEYSDELLDMLSEGDSDWTLLGDLLVLFEPVTGDDTRYDARYDVTFKRQLLAGLICLDEEEKGDDSPRRHPCRLAQFYNVMRQRACIYEYRKAVRARHLPPDTNIVDVALLTDLDHSPYLVPALTEYYKRIKAARGGEQKRQGASLSDMTEAERQAAHRVFFSDTVTVPSLLIEEETPIETKGNKYRTRLHTLKETNDDEIMLRGDAEEAPIPTPFRISPDMVTLDLSLNRNALLTTYLFALSDAQIAAILDSTGKTYSYKKVIEIGNTVTEKLNEILRACDMPILRAQTGELDYLLMTAIYNVDYSPILSRSPSATLRYPYRDFMVEYYPTAEDQEGSEDQSF